MDFIEKTQEAGRLVLSTSCYTLTYEEDRPHFVTLRFQNGIGATLFVASGCDRDEMIDRLIELSKPTLVEYDDRIDLVFSGVTSLWEKVDYTFTCMADRVLYGYCVTGEGSLDEARFFEGFLRDDPRMAEANYPYYCGPGRHLSYHRPVKEFATSSTPHFDLVHSFGVNSADKRIFMYYEDAIIRTNGDRFYLGGDWLFTPAPFLYLMGNRACGDSACNGSDCGDSEQPHWVTMGLVAKAGENNYLDYQYRGGEGFGLALEYQGYTRVDGEWQSPQIVLMACEDVYEGLGQYSQHLRQTGCVASIDRTGDKIPKWWRGPIFGGWGEQVYHSNRWDNYFKSKYDDWHQDNTDVHCTQAAYETMLATLEEKGIDPTILIVDNRWFRKDHQLLVDRELWPDIERFIQEQHRKNRKVILWVSPWSFCNSAAGKDVPLVEQMTFDESASYDLEIDTDVFYDACRRECRKVRIPPKMPEITLAEPRWHILADPFHPDYEERVRTHVRELLSPEGLDADGFEFDYTHFLPQYRGITRNNGEGIKHWGVELNHKVLSIYYDAAKSAKSDALMITQTFNPYFNDVSDMLRLQDIYTDRRSIVEQMRHRANIAQGACPGCLIHSDQHPMPSIEAWREYAKHQPDIGNPCLYYVTGMETTREKLTEDDWQLLRETWQAYREKWSL